MNGSQQHFAPLTPQVFHILLAVARRPQHGYLIRQQVALDSDGVIAIADGTLYPALKRLTARGWLTKLPATSAVVEYDLTRQGRERLYHEFRRLNSLAGTAERRLLAHQYGTSEQFY